MPVAHGLVALGFQRMFRQVVVVEIRGHLGIRPIEDRVNLEGALLLFGKLPTGACAGVGPAQAADPNIGTKVLQCAVHRFDFIDQTVASISFFTLARFPRSGNIGSR